jgi:hypothetical protein
MEERNCSPLRSDLSEVRASPTYFFRQTRPSRSPKRFAKSVRRNSLFSLRGRVGASFLKVFKLV